MTYYVCTKELVNGDHEVHRADCAGLPDAEDLQHLGNFILSSSALNEARKYFTQVNGCEQCCWHIHEKSR